MRYFLVLILWALLIGPATLFGQNYVQQWKQGLSGAKLTAYQGSITSSNSTLTVLELCANGRYRYYREGSWNIPGQAGGASQNEISGQWDVVNHQGTIYLTYRTDQGEDGYFPVYLQNDGKVNIGGLGYRAQQGAARCR